VGHLPKTLPKSFTLNGLAAEGLSQIDFFRFYELGQSIEDRNCPQIGQVTCNSHVRCPTVPNPRFGTVGHLAKMIPKSFILNGLVAEGLSQTDFFRFYEMGQCIEDLGMGDGGWGQGWGG